MSKTKLKIHTWPDKILKRKCKKVKKITPGITKLLDEMLLVMCLNKGLGLAANQVGIDLRLVVVEADDRIIKLVNPFIVKTEGSLTFLEGCLSFPGLELDVKRKNRILIAASNEKGKAINLDVQGTLAVILQHEIDHINGITFINRISFWQRRKISSKLKTIGKEIKDGVYK